MTNDAGGVTPPSSEEATPAARCPVMSHPQAASGSTANQHRWPEQLNLRPLAKNSPLIDPMGERFDYAAEFGPLVSRYLGPEVPSEELIWQDPVPAVDHALVDADDIEDLKEKILSS